VVRIVAVQNQVHELIDTLHATRGPRDISTSPSTARLAAAAAAASKVASQATPRNVNTSSPCTAIPERPAVSISLPSNEDVWLQSSPVSMRPSPLFHKEPVDKQGVRQPSSLHDNLVLQDLSAADSLSILLTEANGTDQTITGTASAPDIGSTSTPIPTRRGRKLTGHSSGGMPEDHSAVDAAVTRTPPVRELPPSSAPQPFPLPSPTNVLSLSPACREVGHVGRSPQHSTRLASPSTTNKAAASSSTLRLFEHVFVLGSAGGVVPHAPAPDGGPVSPASSLFSMLGRSRPAATLSRWEEPARILFQYPPEPWYVVS
jgi:hypothetical protein